MDFCYHRQCTSICRKRYLQSMIITLLILMSFIQVYAQDTGTIRGYVTDGRTGEPLAGANILVSATNQHSTTDATGLYTLAGIKPGKHILRISYIGYKKHEAQVKIHSLDSISGQVIDNETAEPLPDILVKIKGSTMTTRTTLDGRYLIDAVPPGTYTLQVVREGYRPLESGVSVGINELSFKLYEDVIRAEEIVVTGLATRNKKAQSEVAISRLNAGESLAANNVGTTAQLLNGKISGVQMRRVSGNVGSGYRFHMRAGGGINGDGQPLIYLDGVRMDNSEVPGFETGGQGLNLLADLNPEDIENIEVLKGAAAASSYGANGANGVLLITTKPRRYARAGSNKIRLDYKFLAGLNTKTSAYDEAQLLSAADANALFRTGQIMQHSLSASGESDFVRYFTALSSRIEEGILNSNRMNRKNIRANLDVLSGQKISFRMNSSYTINTLERPLNDNAVFGNLFNTTAAPASYSVVQGERSTIENINDENDGNRFLGSFSAHFRPVDFFAGNIVVGVDDNDIRHEQVYPASATYTDSIFANGIRNLSNRNNRQFTAHINGRLTSYSAEALSLSLVAGVELLDRRETLSTPQSSNIVTPLIRSGQVSDQHSGLNEIRLHSRQAGVFAEGNLAYRRRYSVSLKVRRDYASEIGRDSDSVFYPGLSMAWRLNEYAWLPRVFSLLKFRGAYGEAGNLPNRLDKFRIIYGSQFGANAEGSLPTAIGNTRIEPERVKELEVGVDTELFHNLAVEMSWYRQKSEDSILNVQNAPSTGLTSSAAPANVGSMKAWGFETLIFARPWHSQNLNASFTLINNWQTNEVISIGNAEPLFDRFGLNVITEGLPKHEFFSTPVLGARFNDNGTYAGPITGAKRVAFGNPIPGYTGSLSLHMKIKKNLTIYLLADWATARKMWNGGKSVSLPAGNNPEYNMLATQLGLAGSSQFEGIAANVKSVDGVGELTPGTIQYIAAARAFARLDPRFDANFIEDADFLKLRQVAVSYNLKNLFSRLFPAHSPRLDVAVTLSAMNLFTTSNYSGPDPEVNWSGTRGLERGQDFFTLQNPRTFNLAFRISL